MDSDAKEIERMGHDLKSCATSQKSRRLDSNNVASDPIQPFLDRFGVMVLDGGLATHLETLGSDLRNALWSARVLLENPQLIRQVHTDYLWAGADCIISASYQATIAGFMKHGLTEKKAVNLLHLAVGVAVEARDVYWRQLPQTMGRLQPLVAASVGPYAAYRADGSEYTGNYDLDEAGLLAFHRRRWHILAESEADILACETIPVFNEARVLAQLLEQTPKRFAWFSFTCRDERHIVDGTSLAECGAFLDKFPQVVAIGINCTAPRFLPGLIAQLQSVTHKPIIVYPNSGETYNADNQCWLGESVPAEFGTFSREWRKQGAAIIGGCCRTGPPHIRQIRDRFQWDKIASF